MFSVPAVGQSDKKLNPLAKEIVISVAKPWESVFLSSVMVDLVTACPVQFPVLLGVLEENLEPTDSPSPGIW